MRTASSVGPDVVKLKKAAFAQQPSAPTNAHRPPSRFQTARLTAAGMYRALGVGTRGAWALDSRKFGSLEIGKQQRHGSIDDLSQISSRNGVTQQILRSTELVVRGAGHGQLDLVAVGRERRQRNMSWPRGWRRSNWSRSTLDLRGRVGQQIYPARSLALVAF